MSTRNEVADTQITQETAKLIYRHCSNLDTVKPRMHAAGQLSDFFPTLDLILEALVAYFDCSSGSINCSSDASG